MKTAFSKLASPKSLLLLFVFFFWVANYSYVPILSTYAVTLGASYALTGMIVGSYGFVQIFARLPIGMASDALGRRRVFLIVGAAATALSGIGFYFSFAPVWMLIFRSVSGLAVSTWAIQMTAYVSYFGETGRVKAIGNICSVQALGMVFGTFFGGLFAQFFGVRSTFAATLAASAVALVLLCFYSEKRAGGSEASQDAPGKMESGDRLPDKPAAAVHSLDVAADLPAAAVQASATAFVSVPLPSQKAPRRALRPAKPPRPAPSGGPSVRQTLSVLRDGHLLWFSAACMLMQIVAQGACFGFVNNILQDLGANSFMLGLSSTLVTFPAIFSSVLAVGLLKNKFGAKSTLFSYFLVMSASVVAFAFIKNIYLILALQFACGFCRGAISALLTGVATSRTQPRLRSAATALFQAIYGIGMTAGPFIAGLFLDKYNLIVAFIALGALTFLGGLAVLAGDTGDKKLEAGT